MERQCKKVLYEKSKTSLVLMEIIISVFLFMVVSVVCIQMFSKAYTMSSSSVKKEKAAMITGEAADILQSTRGDIGLLCSIYQFEENDNGELRVYFDNDFTECNKEESTYVLNINCINDRVIEIKLTFFESDNVLYSLDMRVASNE